jgi:hypothetical protein
MASFSFPKEREGGKKKVELKSTPFFSFAYIEENPYVRYPIIDRQSSDFQSSKGDGFTAASMSIVL